MPCKQRLIAGDVRFIRFRCALMWNEHDWDLCSATPSFWEKDGIWNRLSSEPLEGFCVFFGLTPFNVTAIPLAIFLLLQPWWETIVGRPGLHAGFTLAMYWMGGLQRSRCPQMAWSNWIYCRWSNCWKRDLQITQTFAGISLHRFPPGVFQHNLGRRFGLPIFISHKFLPKESSREGGKDFCHSHINSCRLPKAVHRFCSKDRLFGNPRTKKNAQSSNHGRVTFPLLNFGKR